MFYESQCLVIQETTVSSAASASTLHCQISGCYEVCKLSIHAYISQDCVLRQMALQQLRLSAHQGAAKHFTLSDNPSCLDVGFQLDGTTGTSTLTSRAFSHASSSPSRPSRESKVVQDERVADGVHTASNPSLSLCERSSQRRFGPRVDSCAPDLSSLCCSICSSSQDDDRMLLCDACDAGYHMFCLRPILVAVPAGHWFCPQCVPAEEVPGTCLNRSQPLHTVTHLVKCTL